jgi:hypothetical protein
MCGKVKLRNKEEILKDFEERCIRDVNLLLTKDGKETYHWTGLMGVMQDYTIVSLFIDKDIKKTKQACYNLAKTIEGYYHHYGDKDVDSKPVHIENYSYFSLAMLSDKLDLLKKFQHFEYPVFNYTKRIEDRKYFIEQQGQMFSYAMQCIINKDFNALNNCIKAAEFLNTKTTNYYKAKHYYLHVAIWKAIINRNPIELEQNILLLLLKTHKHFSMGQLWGEFISMPAIGYLKASWLIGLEVEVKHKLIPMEMMPIKPLEMYTNDFNFFLP